MNEPETLEQFKRTNDFQPTEAIAVIFAAGIFDAVKKYETKKKVKKIEDLEQ